MSRASELVSKRNCSLSPRAALALLAVIATVCLGIAAGFAWFGLWLVLPFAGVEVTLLALAFYLNGRHAGDYERYVFGGRGEQLLVEVREATRVRRYNFNPQWAHIVVRPTRLDVRVAIAAQGRELEIGRHADAAGKRALAQTLAREFAAARM